MDEKSIAFSNAAVTLLKGVINREVHKKQWNTLLTQQAQMEDYMSKIGLELILDETDGYAYLRQQTLIEDHLDIPRLIPRHRLSYQVSLLLVLLRKQLLDFDAKNSAERLILSKQEISEMTKPYLKETTNEQKQLKEIENDLKRIKDMGFIRKLEGSDTHYEVLRILRSFVDAQWLGQMDAKLQEYRAFAQGEPMTQEGDDEFV